MPNPFKLWAMLNGRCCWLTAATEEPPFKVTIFDGRTIVKDFAFEDHDAATAFAIAEMRTAFAGAAGA